MYKSELPDLNNNEKSLITYMFMVRKLRVKWCCDGGFVTGVSYDSQLTPLTVKMSTCLLSCTDSSVGDR